MTHRVLGAAGTLAVLLALSASPALAARPVVEVAFTLDATGSMGPLIEGAKRKIWSIATSILDANPDAEIRMGLVVYRDIGDEFVTRRFDLTTDIQSIYGELLATRAMGGGDWPESVNEALSETVTKLSWSRGPEATRIVFLVGDAPPHMDYAQDVKYPQTLELARDRNIIVNAVQAGDAAETERVWRSIAQGGEGRYIPIPQDGGAVVVIETPFDEEIIELQKSLNDTVVPYGGAERKAEVRRKVEAAAAAPAASASDFATYMARKVGPREAVTGGGDLIGDITAGRTRLDEVKSEALPDSFKDLNDEERAEKVEELTKSRSLITGKIDELVRKRDAFVAEARKREATASRGKGDSFDAAVEETLRAQVKK